MKTSRSSRSNQAGGALLLTVLLTAIALATLGGAMTWSANSTRHTHRAIQFNKAVTAAEGATDKVVGQMTRDFISGGDQYITANLMTYRGTVPKASDSSYWGGWEFADAAGVKNQTSVVLAYANKYTVLDSSYAGLREFVSQYGVTSVALDKTVSQTVYGSVQQDIQLARIPIFQFAMYSSSDMEISCGQPFVVNGRVHSNKKLYLEPDSQLTLQTDVTAVQGIFFARHPDDNRGVPKGGYVYGQPSKVKGDAAAMTLPIGTTNTPTAIREIIQPPAAGEDPLSAVGRLRYHNQAQLVITVSNSTVVAKSGYALTGSGTGVTLHTNEWRSFLTVSNTFYDYREEKTVRAIDLNIAALKAWSESATNALKGVLGSNSFSSVYVLDRRTSTGTQLNAVRVFRGTNLPAAGLTVATARPLYVWGHYNQPTSAFLGTTNTTTTRPASLVADAITVLSVNWKDSNSDDPIDDGTRGAKPTTINAAFLTGVVETTPGKYSGGMENFPRFLEEWGLSNPLTYNGSMVKMFPSLYATNAWGKGDVYAPPKRDWAYDLNFENANKLPPLTPSLVKVLRGQWSTVAVNNTGTYGKTVNGNNGNNGNGNGVGNGNGNNGVGGGSGDGKKKSS